MRSKPFLLFLVLNLFLSFTAQCQKKKVNPDYDQGYYYLYYEKPDSAFLMFTRYIQNADDTLKKGKAFLYMGEMQWNIGDLYGAQESLMGSIRTLDPKDETHREFLGYTYNVLGNVSLDLHLYDEAIAFYNTALPFFTGADYFFEVINGKATALRKKKDYTSAIALYDSTLSLQPADKKLLTRIIDNRAFTKWLANPQYPALAELRTALQIRTDSQYNWGLNASYAHLSDFYARSKPDSALWYAQQMLQRAKANNSPEDILEAIDKMILLHEDPAAKEQWYASYKTINDSLQFSRDTTRNRFALIRYDVQKSKADNLVLQNELTTQRLWMIALITLSMFTIAGLYTWYNKRRKRIKAESDNAIRNARLQTSQKVHDVVANGLYSIMNELEHRDAIDREPLMNRIENLYEQSRNISYQANGTDDATPYNIKLHELLNAFTNDSTKLILVGNQETFWDKVSTHQKQELQLILQEIMVNMKKHSQANNVSLIFKTEKNQVLINYNDDGVGLEPAQKFGNGLKSTVNRIKSLNGDINFGTSGKGGASITISLPLEPNLYD